MSVHSVAKALLLLALSVLIGVLIGTVAATQAAEIAPYPGIRNELPTPVITPIAFGTPLPLLPIYITPLPPPLPTAFILSSVPQTNVEQAHALLERAGLHFQVIIVSPVSFGLEAEIYKDLLRRNFRATSGPDEGFDTSALPCSPYCVFVRDDAVNVIPVESWANVLQHEQRHMVQASNNPALAQAFRSGDGMFTTYAAFLEVCADDGIYVAEPEYHTMERMSQLRTTLGPENTYTLSQACAGNPAAYTTLLQLYENKAGPGTFVQLFPPYN